MFERLRSPWSGVCPKANGHPDSPERPFTIKWAVKPGTAGRGGRGSPLPELGTDVPLDRFQDPDPRFLLCAGPDSGKSAAALRGAERITLSMQRLFKALSGIQEVTHIFPPASKPGSPGRPHLKTTLMEMDPTQQALFRLFALERYGNP